MVQTQDVASLELIPCRFHLTVISTDVLYCFQIQEFRNNFYNCYFLYFCDDSVSLFTSLDNVHVTVPLKVGILTSDQINGKEHC